MKRALEWLAGLSSIIVAGAILVLLTSARQSPSAEGTDWTSVSPPPPPAAQATSGGPAASLVVAPSACTDGITYRNVFDRVDPTTAGETAAAGAVAHVRVTSISESRWNTADGIEPEAHRGLYNRVYRIATVEVLALGKGTAEDFVKVRIFGGELGCDTWLVDGYAEVTVGGEYVVFAQRLPAPDGSTLSDFSATAIWQVDAAGSVLTESEGRRSVVDVMAEVASTR